MLDTDAGKMVMSKGIEHTIKNGVVFDAKQLLRDVRQLVADRKRLEAGQAE